MTSTRLNEQGCHPDLIELQLAHASQAQAQKVWAMEIACLTYTPAGIEKTIL